MSTPDTVYNPKRTFVVQQLKDNILVRGNLPLLDDGSFAYNQLDEQLYATLGNGFHLPNYALIDVPLIDNQGEKLDLQLLFDAFGAGTIPSDWPPHVKGLDIFKPYGKMVAGHYGSLVWMPVQGCVDAANCAAIEPSQYDFAGIVDQLNALMNSCHKTVIYYHCMNGHDRAGSLHAAYLMRHMGKTREQAMTLPPPDGAMAMKHPWKPPYEALINWYASTLSL